MEKLREYKFLKYLNQGAQGKCDLYEKKNDFLKQKVVIKEIKIEKKENLAEHRKEADILKKCSHPFIIGLYEHFDDGAEKLFIVTHYSEGGSLGDEIRERKKCTPKQYFNDDIILQYFTQITMALDYLHSQKIIHRDLKPENILLNGSKKIAKLADFGISKMIENGKDSIKSEKMVIGTGYYIPPEIYNRQSYGKEVDIWALGCVLYEMFELEKAFNCSPALLALTVMSGEYIQPTRITDPLLLAVLKDCLSVDQKRRPTTIQILRCPQILIATAKIMCLTNLYSKTF